MWGRALLARRSLLNVRTVGQKLSSVQNAQVLIPQVLSSDSPFPYCLHFNTLVSPKLPYYQNPRCFSSNPSLDTEESEPHVAPIDDVGDSIDTRTVFYDTSRTSSSESDEGLPTFKGDDNVKINDGFAYGNDDEHVETEDRNFADGNDVGDEYVETVDENGENVIVDDEMGEGEEVDLEKLESCLSLLQSSVVGSLESSLDEMGIWPNEEFVTRLLETPFIPGENLVSFFKWALKKPRYVLTTRALDALVKAVCEGGRIRDVYALRDLVMEVGGKESGLVTTEILNELISFFGSSGKGKAGYEIFSKFGYFGCVPDADTYYLTIEALCRRKIYELASSVCLEMLNVDNLPGAEKVGNIVSYLCKGNKVKDAHSVYVSAKNKKLFPPRSSINYLISSLCRDEETIPLALKMLDDFSEEDRKHAIKPFSSVIVGLCRAKHVEGTKESRGVRRTEDVEEAKKLLLNMIELGPPPGNPTFNVVICGLSKSGDVEEATKIMKLMEDRGLKPDVYTYSVIISGYVNLGEMEGACKILDEAKRKHSKLSPVTYHTLIRGYCRLEQYDKALTLLGEMKEHGVQPNADEYNKLIQSLCLRSLDWGTAEKLLEEMKENGLYLNGMTKGLVRAVKELDQQVESNEVIVGT